MLVPFNRNIDLKSINANPGYQLAVIVPTYNEAGNIARLLARLDASLSGLSAEILFVDDWSSDGTANSIEEIAKGRPDVRVLRRWGRRGLSTAVLEGMMATMAPIVAVIDGDGQHDDAILPQLFEAVHSGRADVAIGSRYCVQGSFGEWDEKRVAISKVATRLAHSILRQPVGDPMSGFFAIRRSTVEALIPRLSGRGFKILFDLLSAAPNPLRVTEVAYRFGIRENGESKLGANVACDFLILLADRLLRRVVPPRLVMFGLVGLAGLVVHLGILKTMLTAGFAFTAAQTGAVLSAIAFNFILNNSITFRDHRLKGWRFATGLASFYAICGLGALANIGVGVILFDSDYRWWLSGVAGAIAGGLWNFLVSSMVTWRK